MGRRDRDERPPVEVWGAEPVAPGDLQRVEIRPGRVRWAPALAVLLILVLGAAALVSGGGGDSVKEERAADSGGDPADEGAADGSTSTTRRTERTTTTTTLPPVPGVPIFEEPVGASLLLAGGGSSWSLLDLDTGEARPFADEGFPPDAYSVVPVQGGVVAQWPGGAQYQPLRGEPVLLRRGGDQVLSSGAPDSVWVGGMGQGDWSELTLVDLTGRVLSGPLIVPGWAQAATIEGALFERGGRVYLHTAEGSRFVSEGTLVATAGTMVVVATCDEAARCEHEAVDTISGARQTFGPSPTEMQGWASLSPDGRHLAVVTNTGGGSRLRVVGAGGDVAWETEEVSIDGPLAWLPGDGGVMTTDYAVAGAVRYHLGRDGRVHRDEVEGLAHRSVEQVIVIPH